MTTLRYRLHGGRLEPVDWDQPVMCTPRPVTVGCVGVAQLNGVDYWAEHVLCDGRGDQVIVYLFKSEPPHSK
jgi:hypothetical protein